MADTKNYLNQTSDTITALDKQIKELADNIAPSPARDKAMKEHAEHSIFIRARLGEVTADADMPDMPKLSAAYKAQSEYYAQTEQTLEALEQEARKNGITPKGKQTAKTLTTQLPESLEKLDTTHKDLGRVENLPASAPDFVERAKQNRSIADTLTSLKLMSAAQEITLEPGKGAETNTEAKQERKVPVIPPTQSFTFKASALQEAAAAAAGAIKHQVKPEPISKQPEGLDKIPLLEKAIREGRLGRTEQYGNEIRIVPPSPNMPSSQSRGR